MLRQPFKYKTKAIECIIPQNSVRIAEPPSSCRCTTAVTSSAITTRSNACHHARASVCSHKQRVCIAFKRYPPEPHSLSQKGIRNECRQCGFFAPSISQWARWDGTLAAEAITVVAAAAGGSFSTSFWRRILRGFGWSR
jgi:hypothetical protein